MYIDSELIREDRVVWKCTSVLLSRYQDNGIISEISEIQKQEIDKVVMHQQNRRVVIKVFNKFAELNLFQLHSGMRDYLP